MRPIFFILLAITLGWASFYRYFNQRERGKVQAENRVLEKEIGELQMAVKIIRRELRLKQRLTMEIALLRSQSRAGR